MPPSDPPPPKRKRKPAIARHKRFLYSTYKIGKEKKEVCVKFPNLEFRKKVAMARRILHWNYTFEKAPHATTDYSSSRTSMKKWENELKKRNKLSLSSRIPYRFHALTIRKRRDPVELQENEKAYGFHVLKNSAPPKHPNSTKRILIETHSNEVLECKHSDYPEPLSHSEEPQEELDITKTETWQCSNWLKAIQKEYSTVEVQEILSNIRIFGETQSGLQLSPALTVIFLETLRSAFFTQNWKIVAQSIEGLCHEASAPYGVAHARHWIFWNVGFYSILRFEKNIKQAIDAVKEFARHFRKMFLPVFYPRRLGIEVAIWLTQEGYFNEGLMFLEEMDSVMSKRSFFRNRKFTEPVNPKRDLIDLMANLIKAVFLYSAWKRDSSLADEDKFDGTDEDLRRSGENALSAFEGLLELTQECEADVTTFLEPLIELTVEYRSILRAKELFKELAIKHYGNMFIEIAYSKFLQLHFPESDEEVAQRIKLEKKIDFNNPPKHWSHQGRAIIQFRTSRNNEITEKLYLKKLPNPEFSW